jgi:uroporphyrinogen-III synthase
MQGKPLAGMKVLILRPAEESSSSAALITELGGEPVILENAVKIEYTADLQTLDKVVKQLDNYDWVVFTSRNGVRIFSEKLKQLECRARRFRVAVVGPATKEEAERHGLRVDFVPSSYLTEALAQELPDVKGRKILLVRSLNADNGMRGILVLRGAAVDEIRPYTIKPLAYHDLEADFDAVILTSPSIVEILRHSKKLVDRIARGALVCCIGPVTAAAAQRLGLRVDVIAEEHTFEGVLKSLIKRVGRNARERCY